MSPLLTSCLPPVARPSPRAAAGALGTLGTRAARAALGTVAALAAAIMIAPRVASAQPAVIEVSPSGPIRRVGEALAMAPRDGHIVVRAGIYTEPPLVITRPLTLEGEPGAILDGGGTHTVLTVAADDVTVRGLTVRNTGPSQREERAGILVRDSRGCVIERNRLEQTLFAIYLSKATDCTVRDNVVRGPGKRQMVSGNGIHVWSSQRVQLTGNTVVGHRDGIYFEFVTGGRVEGNRSEQSARYGMHFMFSNDCHYEDNTFRENGNGVAVMYSNRVEMVRNRFEHNWGSAAYGLLLKDINDSRIEGNLFLGNSVGLHLEGANRNTVLANAFRENGWALKTLANAEGNLFERNTFEANAFDVGTNSRANFSRFRENFWDRYRGYDLDRNGVGDVPHAPVRLFALVVEQSPPTLILLRSLLVDLLDLAERVIPSLTPETLVDERPLMRRPAGAGVPSPGVPGGGRSSRAPLEASDG